MKYLALTRNERKVCILMLTFVVVCVAGFSATVGLADGTPYQLCPARVSIMSTVGADIHCN